MKERVLMHKETGELYLFTNTTTLLKVKLEFCFLAYGDLYINDWDERNFIDMGLL